MPDAGAHVTLELSRDGDRIAGSFDDGTGPQPFTGWLGLLSLLQQALDQTPHASPEEETR